MADTYTYQAWTDGIGKNKPQWLRVIVSNSLFLFLPAQFIQFGCIFIKQVHYLLLILSCRFSITIRIGNKIPAGFGFFIKVDHREQTRVATIMPKISGRTKTNGNSHIILIAIFACRPIGKVFGGKLLPEIFFILPLVLRLQLLLYHRNL